MVVFRVAALCAERVMLGLGLAALAEHGDEGRRVFGEVDIHERLRKTCASSEVDLRTFYGTGRTSRAISKVRIVQS